jgi:2-polyprenyl-3-methyl-5-hydroxy-6-metoxy-1,4-benzoquinol methylase
MTSTNEHLIDWDAQKVSRLWDYYSRTPPYSDVYFSERFGDQLLRRSGLPLEQPLEVLDFGCGPGFIWEHMLRLGARWRYTALDFSRDSVAKAHERGSSHAQFAGAHHVTQLPTELAASNFDALLLFEVVEHLTDHHLEATLREAVRVLRPGGVVVVSTPNEEDLAASTRFCPECGAVFHEWQHVRSWTAASLTTRMAKHGLVRRMVQTLDFRANSLRSKTVKLGRRLLQGRRPEPHMLAVFQRK